MAKTKIYKYIELFLSNQDVAPNSLKLYRANIELFYRWVFKQMKDPLNLTRPDIIEYKKSLEDECKTPLTISSRITTIRAFYKWAAQNEIMQDITIGIRVAKKMHEFKKIPLNNFQVVDLLDSIKENPPEQINLRDKAIIKLMLSTGLRTIEVCRADISDLKNENDTWGLMIQGKGRKSKDDFVDIDVASLDILLDYLASRGDVGPDEPMFTSVSYNNIKGRLKPGSLSHIIKTRLKQAGIDNPKITAHSLRHTAAVMMVESGVDFEMIRRRLRHSSMAFTTIYTKWIQTKHMLSLQMAEAINKKIEETRQLMKGQS